MSLITFNNGELSIYEFISFTFCWILLFSMALKSCKLLYDTTIPLIWLKPKKTRFSNHPNRLQALIRFFFQYAFNLFRILQYFDRIHFSAYSLFDKSPHPIVKFQRKQKTPEYVIEQYKKKLWKKGKFHALSPTRFIR